MEMRPDRPRQAMHQGNRAVGEGKPRLRVAPSIMPSRARALFGSVYAAWMCRPISVIAASARASENGLARRDTYASSAWVRLSTPVSAVVRGGTLKVSS